MSCTLIRSIVRCAALHVCVAIFVGSLCTVAHGGGFTHVISLGDSTFHDSAGNRGPVVPQQIADRMGLPLTRYAQGGATSASLISTGQHTAAVANHGPETLAMMWIGGNDFLNNGAAISFGNYSFLDDLEANVNTAVSTLVADGLDVVLFNLPDLALVPAVQTSGLNLSNFTTASIDWRNRLEAIAQTYGVPVVDQFDNVNVLTANPAAFAVGGIAPILGPAFGTDCGHCLFADPIHPSSLGQGFISINAIDTINANFNLPSPISQLNETDLLLLTGFDFSPDFDQDGHIDATDVDALVEQIVQAANSGTAGDVRFDLNTDGVVNVADLDEWLVMAGAANLPSGGAYLVGDANLDGTVDGVDFVAWNSNKFRSLPAWTAGDFNANGTIDGVDFVAWNAHKFSSSDIGAVPEPMVPLAILLICFGGVRNSIAAQHCWGC
jgi:hypothetical protein